MEIDLETLDGYKTDCKVQERPPKMAKKVYKRIYNCQWEKDSELKLWIAPSKASVYHAECTICGKTLTAGLSELKSIVN